MAVLEAKKVGRWQGAQSYLEPELATPERPPLDERRDSIVRSYLVMRSAIGILGVLLPAVLLLGDRWLLDGSATARGSLSAYYHSGMRDYFVGTLVIVGFCLLVYKIFERGLENTLTFVAGLAALGVAFFPTQLPADGGSLTPLQSRLGEGVVETIHYLSASVLFLVLTTMSWFFGLREGKRGDNRPKVVPGPHLHSRARRNFHWACAGLVSAAIVYIVVTRWVDVLGSWDLLVGESVALVAFGVSWTYKGAEFDVLMPSMAERAR